jgi:hypothetical protein
VPTIIQGDCPRENPKHRRSGKGEWPKPDRRLF